MIGVGVGEERMTLLTDIMGCKVGTLPATCLGLPLSVGCGSKALWT